MRNFRKKLYAYANYSSDMEYLNNKKQDLQSLLQIPQKLYDKVFELDLSIKITDLQIKAIENSLMEKYDENALKERNDLIKMMKDKLLARIKEFLIFNLNHPEAEFHTIIKNLIITLKNSFLLSKHRYKELNNIEFFDQDMDIDRFNKEIELALSNFLVSEYQYGIEQNSFRKR